MAECHAQYSPHAGHGRISRFAHLSTGRSRRVEDMPECFSRPICRLAMQLNDTASDAQRQRLLPFVTRLACADTTEIECKRASYIGLQTAGHYTFEKGLSILEHALVIGRKAEAIPSDAVKTRMLAVQTSA